MTDRIVSAIRFCPASKYGQGLRPYLTAPPAPEGPEETAPKNFAWSAFGIRITPLLSVATAPCFTVQVEEIPSVSVTVSRNTYDPKTRPDTDGLTPLWLDQLTTLGPLTSCHKYV